MNILIPHSWLTEYLDTDAAPEEIQKQVSLCGPSVERIYEREGEPVYDIEVTTNRVDSMSVRGIAREAAVILQQFGVKASLNNSRMVELEKMAQELKPSVELPLPQIVSPPGLYKRTLGIVLANVKRTPTPDWMAKRLLQIDQHVHDSVIDISNYITHELGHPCHAFDYDKVMELGGKFIIKEAEAGKKFVMLDGAEYETVGGEIVFENQAGEIIDLPSIKGTLNTSINQSTKNVFLFVEDIDPKKVRFASMTHAIRTVAAQLLEKNVDPATGYDVMLRGIQLYQELCDAQIASTLYDDFPGKRTLESVTVAHETINQYLGIKLPTEQIVKILSDLGCQVTTAEQAEGITFTVTPPTFRPDITIPADVVEEIARIYGYHNLPSVIMPTAIPLIKPEGMDFAIENRLKRFLAAIGWQEVYTYSMVSEHIALESGYKLDQHLKLQNPLTDDRVYLRRSLLPSLREILTQNSSQPELSVFELAHTYEPQTDQLPNQELVLALVSTRPYRQVKGEWEALLRQFFVTNVHTKVNDHVTALYSQSATVCVTNDHQQMVELGTIGVLKTGQTVIEASFKNLLHVLKTHPTYQPIPKTSPVLEDLTFTIPPQTLVGEIMSAIGTVSNLVTDVQLADVYLQNYTFTITYHDPERNLTNEVVEPIRKEIVKIIQQQFKADLVGKIE